MQGYDRDKALAYMLPRLDTTEFRPLRAQAEALVRRAIELDFEYMHSAGVLNEQGLMGNAYYDDDDAFEYIYERMNRERGCREDDLEQAALAAFIDQYMDLQQDYLEQSGMIGWD